MGTIYNVTNNTTSNNRHKGFEVLRYSFTGGGVLEKIAKESCVPDSFANQIHDIKTLTYYIMNNEEFVKRILLYVNDSNIQAANMLRQIYEPAD